MLHVIIFQYIVLMIVTRRNFQMCALSRESVYLAFLYCSLYGYSGSGLNVSEALTSVFSLTCLEYTGQFWHFVMLTKHRTQLTLNPFKSQRIHGHHKCSYVSKILWTYSVCTCLV